MASDFAAQLKEEARPFLEQGEEIVASIVAQPRGSTNSMVGGVAPQAIGSAWAGKSKQGAEAAGLDADQPDGARAQRPEADRVQAGDERDGQAEGC